MTVDSGLLNRLRVNAADVDASSVWPRSQLEWLAETGILRWNIPAAYGGSGLPPIGMTAAYEALASACLNTTFILTQRNAACQRIADSENVALREKLLPRLAMGELFATVGISHLTTSRQHLAAPPVQITEDSDALRLTGSVPWVTGAEEADVIVTGGTCQDGRQMLVALPRELEGISVSEPTRLLALNASRTSSITLTDVAVASDLILAGPVEGVMNRTQGGAGSVTTSALAVGLAARSLTDLQTDALQRPELHEIASPFQQELDELRRDLYAAVDVDADSGAPRVSAAALRQRANSLVLRVTQARLAASKGAGYVSGHPAERAVRESLFFLVWSCPQPVVAAALREFACLTD